MKSGRDSCRWQNHAGRDYLSKKGDDPRTDRVKKGADSELPGWQPKEKEA